MKGTVKQGFKFGLGFSLAWLTADGLNKAIGKRIAPTVEKLTDKLNGDGDES